MSAYTRDAAERARRAGHCSDGLADRQAVYAAVIPGTISARQPSAVGAHSAAQLDQHPIRSTVGNRPVFECFLLVWS